MLYYYTNYSDPLEVIDAISTNLQAGACRMSMQDEVLNARVDLLATLGPNGMSDEILGVIAAFMGIIGLIGGVIVGSFKYPGGALMVIAGIVGFFVVSLIWLVPGVLLIIGGMLTFKNPRAMQVYV